jgi:ribosome-binding protein aMBF1 (putative translation factor)
MNQFLTRCFACGKEIDPELTAKNKQLNLPVCDNCRDTEKEQAMIQELNEGMADGFVCGCI